MYTHTPINARTTAHSIDHCAFMLSGLVSYLVFFPSFTDSQDGFGLMLIKLQRLLALACRTQRTLVLPHGTYNELTRLVDLSPLQAVGHCLLSGQNDWQARQPSHLSRDSSHRL
jgi:hypothetical protein